MRLLLGKQIVLKEFLAVDLVISWVDEIASGANDYLIGSEKGFIYFSRNSDEILYGSGANFLSGACGRMAVLCSDLPLKWEDILKMKEEGATFFVVFTRADRFADLLLAKSICWGCSCEFQVPIALAIKNSDVVHYQLSVPNQGENGLVIDTTATTVFDVDVLESSSGLFFNVKTSAWNWLK